MSNKFGDIAKAQPDNPGREPIPAGSHIARCYSIIDLGTQEVEWEGQKKHLYQINITWELSDIVREFEKNGEKYSAPISKGVTYSFSFGEKSNLQKHLTGWMGKEIKKEEFSEELILDKYCMLTLVHKKSKSTGNTYEQITGISPLHGSITPPDGYAQLVAYSISQDKDNDIFENLPDFLKERIKKSPEWKHHVEGEKLIDPAPKQSNETPPIEAYSDQGNNII